MSNFRTLVVGSANIDFILSTPFIPVSGETLVSNGTYAYVPGGKGANSAITAARLGTEVIFCTRVGDDAYGDRLKQIYKENNIDLRFVRVDKTEQTGLAVILLESNGANRIIVYPGANKNINEADIEAAFTAYPDLVIANMEMNEKSIIYTAQYAEKVKVPLILDCGGISGDFKLETITKAEIISPNEIETEILTGIRPDSLDNCLKACIKICNMTDIKYVVLKLGSRGSYIYDGKYCDICGPYEVQAVDTTAAGDAFTSAMAVEYMNSKDIYTACRYANAAGALTVTKMGAINSLPTHDEIVKFMAEKKQI
ncbi:ribokinase [Eubacteriales bacterium OttesenSCG-928-G02]|nr:ribokinase [Eubacteriales bacterium OttesenSCG-928-G02]